MVPSTLGSRSWTAAARFHWLAATLLAVTGCGGEPFKYIPVSGKVTYADGSLIAADQIFVKFVPEEARISGKDVAPAATGEVNPQDGTFPGVTTHKYLDGAVAGAHKVTVVAYKVGADGAPALSKAVPEKYQSPETTPLRFEVVRGCGPAEFKVDRGR